MLLLGSAARGRTRHGGLFALLAKISSRDRARALPIRRYAHIQPHNESRIEDLRNIGIIAHVDAGKTTTTERMLFHSGVTRHLGNVDHGDTVTDFLPMERERGITIQSAAITFHWPVPKEGSNVHSRIVNLIDTPGHQDFRFEVDRCLPILDGAICVIDGVKGVEAHTERVWEAAQDFGIPRLLYVNKLDRDGASFRRSVIDIGSKLKGMPVVCNIPWWSKERLTGVIDIVDSVGYKWNADKGDAIAFDTAALHERLAEKPEVIEEIKIARERLVEQLCDHDETLLSKFLDAEEKCKLMESADIKAAIRRIVNKGDGSVIPVFAGSSLKNMGVEPLLDAVVDYLPSPKDRPEVEVQLGSEKMPLQAALAIDAKSHPKPHGKVPAHPRIGAVASVFKVVNDPARGMISFVRVYHGELSRKLSLWNSSVHSFEKPLGLMQISANKTQDIQHLTEGQIGAIVGLKGARTGDTLLTFPQHKSPPLPVKNLAIRPAVIPPAVAFVSIDPISPSAAKVAELALEKTSREDPSLRWSKDETTDQYVLSGMGKLHLEVAKHNLKTNYKVEGYWGGIEVDYKECILSPTDSHHAIYDRVVAGKEGKAGCSATVIPLEDHHKDTLSESCFERDGNVVHIRIPLGQGALPFDPEDVRPQLLNGALAGLSRGPRRGAPLHRCHVTITFDKNRDYYGNASGAHYFSAAYRAVGAALREAFNNNQIGLMEPVMKVNLMCPEDVAGTIQHDISSSAGGQVLEIVDEGKEQNQNPVDMSEIYAPPDPYDTVRSQKPNHTASRVLEIVAKVPLKSMLDYDDHLRSKTKGRHSMIMTLDTFERVTGHREKALEL
ncbi:hypothetical protein MKZ38_008506 [Zalerion maritima]|uniref:Elongation factor 2 n=1 Tax=Zalerion maritima TaxID=339359 RepID=A0AAD5WNK5_9PEZI|nr:hypothetical protein MKZ38_008506 [Zalerion maritima]